MKILKISFRIFLLLIVAFIIFFFWASSSTLKENEYSKLLTFEHPKTIDNDSIFSIVTYNIGYLSGMTNNLSVETPKELFDKNLEKLEQLVKILESGDKSLDESVKLYNEGIEWAKTCHQELKTADFVPFD